MPTDLSNPLTVVARNESGRRFDLSETHGSGVCLTPKLALRCPQMAAQLTRSETDRVIAGVAGGIAERFGLDPTLVRIAWVVSIFFGGFGILLYVVLWIALPTGPSQSSAIRIAEERYARGEISTEELRRIRGDLQSSA
jgi:phage shock protein C